MSRISLLLLIFLGVHLSAAQLPVEIRALHHDLAVPGGDPDHARKLQRLKTLVTTYILHQIDTFPAIPGERLRAKLRDLLPGDELGTNWKGSPLVTASPPGEGRVVLVAYEAFLGFYGTGGSVSIIDSYVYENGKARLAGRLGTELPGIHLNGEPLLQIGNAVYLLAFGTVYGSNGIPGAGAAVYRADASGVRTVWKSEVESGLRATSTEPGQWVVVFVDGKRYYHYPLIRPFNVLELWELNGQAKPERLLKHRY